MLLFRKVGLGNRLTLRELEASTSAWLTCFFAFFHPWITGEETFRLHQTTVGWIHFGQSAGDGVPNGDCLSVLTAAFDDHLHVECIFCLNYVRTWQIVLS
jgi:hypothetical protein